MCTNFGVMFFIYMLLLGIIKSIIKKYIIFSSRTLNHPSEFPSIQGLLMLVVRFFRSAVIGECKHLETYILRNQETIWESHTWKRWNHAMGRNVSKAISVTVAYFPLATYDVNSIVSSIDLYWTQQKLNNVTFQWASVIFMLRFDNRKRTFCRVVNCW